ncbi:MAG: aminoacyl-tRNA hydrolase [Actinomycetota bacterium]
MVRSNRERSATPVDLVVVGLGNPGDDYAQTRHNAGFWVVDELVRRHGGKLRRGRRDHAESDVLRLGDRRVVVAQPTTFYNEAGRAVGALLKKHGIVDHSRLVLVHDELDLPVGRMKLKFGGGLAGNNGLKSVRAHLRSEDFSRVRVGVGKPASGTVTGRDWVLKRPARAERPILEQVVADAADALEYLAGTDIEAAMNLYNRS